MEFFESIKFNKSGTVINTIITLVINKEVVVLTLYLLLTFFNNIKILNVMRLHFPDKIKLKGEENY
jgi:uncharacterized membrane protein YhaH (DUF805 family)